MGEGTVTEFYEQRRRFSVQRRRELAEALASASALQQIGNLAIYVCGSLGRDEAAPESDLDLFEVVDDTDAAPAVTNVLKYQVFAQVIATHEQFGYEAPSNDGQYLALHSLRATLGHLGGPQDDYENEFTARMLLLLESRPLYGESVYNNVVSKTVDAYFRDYDDHKTAFRAVFLLNDVMRYWKTLCLNYEYRRNPGPKDPDQKAKNSRKNVKLKFSRLLICFSMIVPLASNRYTTKEAVLELVRMTPLARLDNVARYDKSGRAAAFVESLKAQYSEFLKIDAANDFETRLKERNFREEMFERGNRFAGDMFELLLVCAPPGDSVLRYAVI